jgi:uncharacterized protein YbbK (DUF523 family)
MMKHLHFLLLRRSPSCWASMVWQGRIDRLLIV